MWNTLKTPDAQDLCRLKKIQSGLPKGMSAPCHQHMHRLPVHVRAALLATSWVQAAGSAMQRAGHAACAELLPVIITTRLAHPAAQQPGLPDIQKWGRWVLSAAGQYIITQTAMCQPISRISRSLDQMCRQGHNRGR